MIKYDFTGQTVMITGSNRGLGRTIMEFFLDAGANIIPCARGKNPELEQFYQEQAKRHNCNITPLYFDLVEEKEIKAALTNLQIEKINVDVLINNAGMPHMGYLQFTPISKIKEVFQVNFFSVVLLSQIVSKIMIRQKKGAIVNIGSMAGLENFAGYSAYGSSKAALMQFTRTLAREMAPFNVRVNCVAPGLMEDGMGRLQHDKSSEEIIERTDLKKRGLAQDVANLVLYLSSEEASFITGQIYRIDGGM